MRIFRVDKISVAERLQYFLYHGGDKQPLALECTAEGVFACTTQTRYNAPGGPLVSVHKQIISQLSPTLAEKVIAVDERGLTSVDWVVYNNSTKRTRYSSVPTSDITAETVVVDGFTLSQKDTAGIISTATRSYTAGGMVLVHTDGRGNATTTVTDIAGRTLTVTDAAGNVTTTTYCPCCDQPATITDAQGNTSCYKYDIRGRKVAEWGTALQPACFGYDDAGNLVSLKTFRGTPATNEDGSPSQSGEGAAAGDQTTWTFDAATGLELCKTYADNSSVVKTYDAFNRLATETDARGIVKNHSYESARGLLLSTGYSDDTAPRSFAYNHLGQLTQVTDDAGVRSIGYNAFGEQETDSLLAGDKTHLITETRDALGRSTGFVYSKDGTVQHTVTTGYGADGRISTAGFMHGGSEKQFGYTYLPGSHLLQTLTMPCNMTLTQSYESQRDLLIGMAYHRGNTLVTQRSYSYDTLGRPLTRSTNRSGQTVNDSFGYNTRSELTSATVNGSPYGYDYDHIGNRITAEEGESSTEYTANELNQYTAVGDFSPTFDATGNQTLVKTATGIWSVEYNAENRPVRFTRADGATIIECSYDTMGRRATKKVTTNGSVTLHQRYIYRGYLQIACCDLTRAAHPALWFITWDPTQPIATRPLAICKDGTWFAYGWDLTKNICEVFGPAGYIRTSYAYSPFGTVEASGDVEQPIQWSGEFNNNEIGLVYYNYRYYNPLDGRWINFDPIGMHDDMNLYSYVKNSASSNVDKLGLNCEKCNEYLAKKMQTYAITIANIRRKCKLDITCEDTDDGEGNRVDGYVTRLDNRWNPFSSVHIYLAIDCCTGANEAQDSEEDSFGHELVHAQDYCNNDDPDTGCKASVCSELRAYTIGGCKGMVGPELKSCLEERVPASSLYFCDKNDTLVQKMIDENYEKCLKGYPH